MTLTFVNYKGDPLPPPAGVAQKRQIHRSIDMEYHKGWRVVGHPPGAMEEAQRSHDARQAEKREPKPFDRQRWEQITGKKSVRTAPYQLHDAAKVCADLATKAGWLSVEIREVKRSKHA